MPDPIFEALEQERQRLARLLEREVIESLQLMLAQAGVYEQTFVDNAQARLVISVLGKLTRDLLQQVRDLEASLHPAILDDVGLEAAFQTLAVQVRRTSGIQVQVVFGRGRLPLDRPVQIGLYRLVQGLIDGAGSEGHGSQVWLQLETGTEGVRVLYRDDRLITFNREPLRTEISTLEGWGGVFFWEQSADQFEMRLLIPARAALTPTEYRVLRLLVEGLSNKQIAVSMSVSPRTVNFHLDNIYAKLGVNSRTEAVIFALNNHLLQRDPR